ncbi:DUF4349 domain-containing protein, partial [Nocardioides sp.]|uniref:DUF4349 domain-containing protein n=1 Tax=Nocardioides sp. TaxID=35761 RepID=UPI002B26865E
ALAATAALALLALVGACSVGSESDSASSTAGGTADFALPESAPVGAPEEADAGGRAAADGSSVTTTSKQVTPGESRSVIRTGNVALRSGDVPAARFDVGKVLAAHGGEVAQESTRADADGDAEWVQLTLRVPVAKFDSAMTALQEVADLIDVSTSTEDVTTEVIDTDVRVALQRRSIERISVLLDNAADLGDIVSIESELSRREADLGSLEKRQAFLADQTSMATITVSIEPLREDEEPPADDDRDGFLAGLDAGWNALKDVTTGLLTVGGAVLPFALVALAFAVPGRLLARRYLKRTPAAAPPPPATA